jgi:pimeloyl-ACP methyl ester carboxylesterase
MSDTAPALATGTVTMSDGTGIHYTDRGRGEPAVVLVHGWAMDSHIWDAQAPPLAARHRVVTLDLAGHGRSGKDRRTWTMASLGDDVAAVAEALGLHRLVLVGHSMGGAVVLEAARRLRGRVTAIVLVDMFLDVEQQMPPEQIEAVAQQLREDYKGTTTRMSDQYQFATATPAGVRERVLAQSTAMDPTTSIALLRETWGYDPRRALREIKAPVRAVSADKFPTNLEANRRHMPGYEAEILAGSGHYPMLEMPERFQRALARALGDEPG